MALLNLACRVVVLLMIAAVPGKIIAMPSNSDVHNHDSAFGVRYVRIVFALCFFAAR